MGGLDHMKPTHRTCVTCRKEFQFSNKTYHRTCVSSLIGEERIADILFAKFSLHIADRTSYICNSCRGYLVHVVKYEKKVMQRIGMKAAEDTQPLLPLLQEEEEKQHWLRNVTFYHALLFLEDVILKYWETPDIVIQLLEILSKWRVRVIDTKCVKSQVKELFDSAEDLLLGFNVFVPPRHQYHPDPDKVQEKDDKTAASGEKSIGSEKITETENLSEELQNDKDTRNDDQPENKNENENQSETVRNKKRQSNKKFGSRKKRRKRNKNDNSELKQIDDSVEDTDDITKQNVLNNDEIENASQDMDKEKQDSAENLRSQAWTMLDDSGTEITVSENMVDNSEMESDTENWEHGDQSQSWLDEDPKTLHNVEKNKERSDKIATSGQVCKDTDNENPEEDGENERKNTQSWQNENDRQCQSLQVKPKLIDFPMVGKTVSETELHSENSQDKLWTLNLHNTTGNQSPDVVKGNQSQETNKVTNPEAVKKVLTQEASSENSSERRPTESQPPLTSHTHSTSQAEGMQNENMAADFKSEDKNKDQEFEIQEREFEVKLQKPKGRDLGFTLTHGPGGDGFYLKKIFGSPALTPPRKLQPGDRILKINNVIIGCTDQSSVEKFILKQDGLVSIRVRRLCKAISSAYCERKVSSSELVKLRESKHLETGLLSPATQSSGMPMLDVGSKPLPPQLLVSVTNPTSQSAGMPTLDVGSKPLPPQLLVPVTKPPEGPLLVPLMQPSMKPLLVPLSYMSTPYMSIPVTVSSTMLTQSTTSLLSVTQTSSASLTQSSIMSCPSITPLLVPVTMSSKVSLAQSTSTSLVAPGFQPSLMKLPLLIPKPLEMSSVVSSVTPLPNSEFNFSKTSSVTTTTQASISTSTVSSSKSTETHVLTPVSKTSVASVSTSTSGSEIPLNIHVSRLAETQGLNPVSKSSVMKLPIQLSDASKRQLLESVSKSADSEAILVGQKGIIKICKVEKPQKEVAGTESGQEISQKQTKVSPELKQVSDSEQTLSKTTTIVKGKPLLSITQSVMTEIASANMTQNEKDVPVSRMRGNSLSNVIQAGIKQGPLLSTIQTSMKESPLTNVMLSNLTVEPISNAKKTVVEDSLHVLPSTKQALAMKVKPLPNVFQTDTKEGPLSNSTSTLMKSGPLSSDTPIAEKNRTLLTTTPTVTKNRSFNNTQSIMKDRSLSGMTQSMDKERSLLTTTSSVIKSNSISYKIQTGVKQKPKSDTTQTVMKEPKPVDATDTVVEEISTASLANVAENTKKTLLKAAFDLVKKTKHSNPELQNFKLSFIKTDELDKEKSLKNIQDALTVKLKDTKLQKISEWLDCPAQETGNNNDNKIQSVSATETQDGNSAKSTNRSVTQDSYNYFQYVKTKKEKPTPKFKGGGKKKQDTSLDEQKLKSKSTLKHDTLDRAVENDILKSAKAKIVSGNELDEAENENVTEASIGQSDDLENTVSAESDNEFEGSGVPPDPEKPHNIIELDHPYTTGIMVTSPDNSTAEMHMSPRPSTSAVIVPKLEKSDTESAISTSPGTSGLAAAANLDSEMPMSPAPSSDFLKTIQMKKLEIPDIGGADAAGGSGQPVDKTDDTEFGPSQSQSKHHTAKSNQVLKPKRTSMRLTNKAQRRKLKLLEDDHDPVPAKKPKYRVVWPVKKQPVSVKPEDCCVHCFRSFRLHKSTRISVKEYLKTDNGNDHQVLLGTFLKYEAGVGHINPQWCVCQMCYIVCEKIQRWREQFVGSKENLENAQTEFLKRKNSLGLLYNKNSRGQTHERTGEGALLSVRNDDNYDKEVDKQREITRITKKIWSEVEQSNRSCFTEKCVRAVRSSHYDALLRHLVSHSKSAKASLLTVVKGVIRKEVTEYITSHKGTGTSILECNSFADIEKFNWVSVMEEFSALPFLSGVLKATLTKSDRQKYVERCFPRDPDKVQREFGIAFGVLVSVLFYFRNRRYNMFQTINSIQMYEKNCSKQLFTLFWNVGFCCRQKSQIRGIVTNWTSEKLGTLEFPNQVKIEATRSSNTSEEEMEVPYRYDRDNGNDGNDSNDVDDGNDEDDGNENEQTSDELRQDGQLQLRENEQSEQMAEENTDNEELRHALGTIESLERMAQGDTQGNVDMEGDNQVYYVAEETGQYVPDYGIEVEEVGNTDAAEIDDKTESVVTEVRESQADNVQDTDNATETEVTVKIESIRDDGTIEIDYQGQEGTELRSLDEWIKIFASKS